MRKSFKILLSIIAVLIIIVFVFGIGYRIHYRDYFSAIKFGSEILKAEYPYTMDNDTKFVAYFHDNIWHVQNVILDDEGDGGSIDVYEDIDAIKYVKLDKNFEKIFIGDYNNEFTTDNEEYKDFGFGENSVSDVAKKIARQTYFLPYKLYAHLQYDTFCWEVIVNEYETEEILGSGYYYNAIRINIRSSDGMIMFLHKGYPDSFYCR